MALARGGGGRGEGGRGRGGRLAVVHDLGPRDIVATHTRPLDGSPLPYRQLKLGQRLRENRSYNPWVGGDSPGLGAIVTDDRSSVLQRSGFDHVLVPLHIDKISAVRHGWCVGFFRSNTERVEGRKGGGKTGEG